MFIVDHSIAVDFATRKNEKYKKVKLIYETEIFQLLISKIIIS